MNNNVNFYLVYDFHLENDFLPNGLNIETADIVIDNLGFIDGKVIQHYFNYQRQIPVNNTIMNINDSIIKRISLYEYFLLKDKEPNSIFIYIVEPYANINHILGSKDSFTVGKSFLDFSSDLIKQELKNSKNKFYCIISFPTEGDASSYIFKSIYDISDKNNIDKSKFIFISASYNVEDLHQEFLKDNEKYKNLNEHIKTFYWSWSLREKAQEAYETMTNQTRFNMDGTKSEIVTIDDIDLDKKRNKKFLIFNRRMRAHRIVLISLLGFDFITKNYVSYDLTKGENDYSFSFFKESNRVPKEYEEFVYENFMDLDEKLPISQIDFENVFNTMGFGCEVKKPYLDSYIHVVTETNFYEPGVYFSEKTWKPILNFQPFIQLNYANSLKALKDMGFKTFHPFIDESYDEIENDGERIIAVYKEIERLNNLSTDELHSWYVGIMDILEYNRNLALEGRMNSKTQYHKEKEYINSIKKYINNNHKIKNQKLL